MKNKKEGVFLSARIVEFNPDFPRAILHVDGDAFFVACEVACNPSLRGKPVVTGGDRRIVSALSYEAKAIGVKRGMPIFEVRKLFPQVIVVPTHFRLYEIFSNRMFRIVSRFTPIVEWYSVDECFADITGLDQQLGKSYEEIAAEIQETLGTELGLSFSVGLASTKVLAKVASKWKKPCGRTIIPGRLINDYLKEFPIGKVWGIGSKTNQYLGQFGIETALDLVNKSDQWITEHCSRPIAEIRDELMGRSLHDVRAGKRSKHKSLSSTETFIPLSSERAFLLSELSRHVEDVTHHARREGLAASHISFFIKTRDFRYRRTDCALPEPTALPHPILEAIRTHFDSIYDPSMVYRACGVTLFDLVPISHVSQSLFDSAGAGSLNNSVKISKSASDQGVYKTIDELIRRYGSHVIHVASSLGAFKRRPPKRRTLSIPILGKVS